MSSAQEIRARLKAPRPVTVQVPGTDLTIECRRPDLVALVTSGLIQWPALERVRTIVAEQRAAAAENVIDNRPLPTVVDHAQAVGEMLDQWVCLSAVSPRIVLTEYEVTPDTLCVLDLPYDVRLAIFAATNTAPPQTARADFRDESDGAPPGPSGEAVRGETF